jgi:hypothetical protein
MKLINEKSIYDDQVVPHFKKAELPQKPNMVNINRLEDINERISERNLPSSFLYAISVRLKSAMFIL